MNFNIPVFTPTLQNSFLYPLQPIWRCDINRFENPAYCHNVYASTMNPYLHANTNIRIPASNYGRNVWESSVFANTSHEYPLPVTNRKSFCRRISFNRNMNPRSLSERIYQYGSQKEQVGIAEELQIFVTSDGEREIEIVNSPTSNEVLCSDISKQTATEDCGTAVLYKNAGLRRLKSFCMRELYKCKKCKKRIFCRLNSPFKCGRKFLLDSVLKTHYRSHIGENSSMCKECGRQFSQKSNLLSHYSVHYGSQKSFCCGVRRKQFSREDSFKSHCESHGNTFKCGKCERQFSLRMSLNEHYRKCSGQKTFACKICQKQFHSMESVESHSKTHSGRHEMGIVGGLQISITLAGEREVEIRNVFKCGKCGRQFPSNRYLRKHSRKHNRTKTLRCDICNNPFSSKISLNRHHKTHAKEKSFTCESCLQKFLKINQFDMHHADPENHPLPSEPSENHPSTIQM